MLHYSINTRLLQLLHFFVYVLKRVHFDRIPRHAAALSFNSLLALAPILALMLAMLSLFSSFKEVGDVLQNFVYKFLIPTAGDELKQYLDGFASQTGRLTFVGVITFLLTALLLLFNIEYSFNDIWRVEKGRSIAERITVYWSLLTLGPVLMGASLAISTYILSYNVAYGAEYVAHIQNLGTRILPFMFEASAFCFLYYVMPNARVRFVHALFGGVFAAILFSLMKKLFALYITNFNSYEVIYGALATLPIFLIWVYVSWLVALLGAEVVAALQVKPKTQKKPVV